MPIEAKGYRDCLLGDRRDGGANRGPRGACIGWSPAVPRGTKRPSTRCLNRSAAQLLETPRRGAGERARRPPRAPTQKGDSRVWTHRRAHAAFVSCVMARGWPSASDGRDEGCSLRRVCRKLDATRLGARCKSKRQSPKSLFIDLFISSAPRSERGASALPFRSCPVPLRSRAGRWSARARQRDSARFSAGGAARSTARRCGAWIVRGLIS